MPPRLTGAVLAAWPALLASVLAWPLLSGPGLPLAKDLVFVPDQPLTDSSFGLGDAAPRAVPLDAVVGVLDEVVGGAVLARLLVWLCLALAGWGVTRLLDGLGTLARLSAAGFAVWNPFVVERLALGQWALLLGYAALPWVVLASRTFRDRGGVAAWAAVTCWVAVGSVTPTGGLLASATALVMGLGARTRTAVLAATCLVLQLPWLVPAFAGGAGGTSDPTGVDVFSAGDEGPGSVVTALLGLGGIWDAGSVPSTREGWWTPVAAAVAVLVVVSGRRVLRGVLGPDLRRLTVLAAAGFGLAVLSSVPGGLWLVEGLVDTVPGAGLLRDSHKFLAPYALLVTVSLAGTVHRLALLAARSGGELLATLAVVAVPLPLVLLPDATVTVWPTVEPVDYPDGFTEVERILHGHGGDLAVLPWRSYRGFEWGNGEISSDPALRWFDRDVLASQDLQVGDVLVRGEGDRSERIGQALETRTAAEALAGEGVSWALVYRDDPAYSDDGLTGLRTVYRDDRMALLEVPGAAPGPSAEAWRRALVQASAAAAALVVAAAAGVVLASGSRRIRRDAGKRRRTRRS